MQTYARVRLFAFLLSLSLFLPLVHRLSDYRLNTTPSLPLGLYRLGDQAVAAGSTVVVCLPADLALEGARRKILRRTVFSKCGGRARPVMKLALALPGDTVTITETAIAVNGKTAATWERYHPDAHRPVSLPRSYRLGPNQVWLHGLHPYSWDSRHFGPVRVLSDARVAQPILTYKPKELR